MTVERDEQDSPPEPNHAESYDTDIRFAIPGYETLHESAVAVLAWIIHGGRVRRRGAPRGVAPDDWTRGAGGRGRSVARRGHRP